MVELSDGQDQPARLEEPNLKNETSVETPVEVLKEAPVGKSVEQVSRLEMPMAKPKRKIGRWVFGGVFLVLIVTIGVVAYLNRVLIKDWISAMSYEEPERMLKIEKDLELTDGGSLILRASHAMIETEDVFNENCRSYNVEISITGCYAESLIHIYEINYEELDGILESTVAHELLHAAWERLDESEKERVGQMLREVYSDSRFHGKLSADLGIYESGNFLDELHSRVGTEFKDLPSGLEEYYARYFKDQDKVVSFYEKYSAEFERLKTERDEIELTLTELKDQIESLISEYEESSSSYSEQVKKFNECAKTAGCFKDDAEFNTKRRWLLSWHGELNDMHDKITDLVNRYNMLVEKYNNNVLHNQKLFNMMNSNVLKDDDLTE